MSSNRIYFSDFYNVEPTILEEYGAFNISLLNDLPLFIDPFLIFCSEDPKYKKLHEGIIEYMVYLREQALQYPNPTEGMLKAWYLFPEVKQTYLGFCEDGNSGRGLGHDFAIALHTGLKDIFKDFGNEKITRSPHLEKLCLIKEKVGRDNISDFVTNLIKEYLLTYTEQFAKEYIDPSMCKFFSNIPRVKFNYEIGVWQNGSFFLPCVNKDFVLLTPMDMLVRAETWINKKDMYNNFEQLTVSLPDAALRFEINQYFHSMLSKKAKKIEKISAAHQAIAQYPQFIDYYISKKEDEEAEAIANSVSEVGGVKQIFIDQLQKIVELLKTETDFYKIKSNSYDEPNQTAFEADGLLSAGHQLTQYPVFRSTLVHLKCFAL